MAGDILRVNGAKLHYEAAGSGDALILIHPRWVNSHYWDQEFPVFAHQFHTVRYDIRGFGQSTMKTIPYSDVEDLRSLMDHQGIDRAYLLGLELGSQIAMQFANKYPGRVRALLLASPTLDDHERSPAYYEAFMDYLDAARRKNLAPALDAITRMWVNGPAGKPRPDLQNYIQGLIGDYDFVHHEKLREPVIGDDEPTLPDEDEPQEQEQEALFPEYETPSMFARRKEGPTAFSGIDDIPEASEMQQLMMPALLMVGEFDWPEHQQMARTIARNTPINEQTLIAGAGHYINLEAHDNFVNTVMDFLNRY